MTVKRKYQQRFELRKQKFWDPRSLTSESEDNIGRVFYVPHKIRHVASEVQKL